VRTSRAASPSGSRRPPSQVAIERPELVGLIPAAGRALRLGLRLGGASKEILPVGRDGRPVARLLLESLALAGIERAYVLLRAGKRDVRERLADGAGLGVRLDFLVIDETSSIAETLDQAYPLVRGRRVALGFPDILFRPLTAFARVLEHQAATGADAVLGLVPTDRPDKADLAEVDAAGRVRRITIKPGPGEARPDPPLTWIAAVWGPALTELLHREVAVGRARRRGAAGRELYPGDVLQRAIEEGLRIEAVTFPEGRHLDIGTPEDLARAAVWPD
jgi:glucose-1-phosphate thymidylyltransferase